ncbi:unnamed protein product, partial [Meganyctiphanes norvegica]
MCNYIFLKNTILEFLNNSRYGLRSLNVDIMRVNYISELAFHKLRSRNRVFVGFQIPLDTFNIHMMWISGFQPEENYALSENLTRRRNQSSRSNTMSSGTRRRNRLRLDIVEDDGEYVDNVETYLLGRASGSEQTIGEETRSIRSTNVVMKMLGFRIDTVAARYVYAAIASEGSSMDPAGPLFWNRTIEHRLDASDAAFVDIMHSNSGPVYDGCMGMLGPLGHVDFYPNGGTHQPGCAPPIPGGDIIDMIEDCSHMRSAAWFVESLTFLDPEDLKFQAWPCANYEDYQAGHCQDCGQGCIEMGFFTQPGLNGSYYLRTKAFSPYAKGDQQ